MDNMNYAPTAMPVSGNDDLELTDFNFETSSAESKNATVADSDAKEVGDTASTQLTDGQLEKVAERIRARNSQAIACIIDNGRDLIAVKNSLGHGKFMPWIKKEFVVWSERTAQNYMNAARNYGELIALGCTPEEIATMSPTSLYDFGKLKNEQKGKSVKALKLGAQIRSRATKAKGNKPGNSKTAEVKADKMAGAAPDKFKDAAEQLVKIISDRLGRPFAVEYGRNPGFQSPEFGKLLSKALNDSFGVPSNGGNA